MCKKTNPEVSGGIVYPKNDILSFPYENKNIKGRRFCPACHAEISETDIIHQCVADGYIFNTYRLSPDKTIWRKD